MRIILIATFIALFPSMLCAQSRPAPDTPGESAVIEEEPAAATQPSMVGVLRVLVVTSGIIGGFVAADIFSGGTLTAPLLASAARMLPPTTSLRPIITALPAGWDVVANPELDGAVVRQIGRQVATPLPAVRSSLFSLGALPR